MSINPILLSLMKKNKPTEKQIEDAIDAYLEENPIPIQDASISESKLDANLKKKVNEASNVASINDINELFQ